jgi:hypothetical protein
MLSSCRNDREWSFANMPFALNGKGEMGWNNFSFFPLMLGVFILVSTLSAVANSYSGMLFWDEWGEPPTPAVILHNLFAQHNEHRLVIPRLFFLVDKYLFAGSNLFTLTSNLAAQLCTAIILIGVAWRYESGRLGRPAWIIGLVLGLLFSGYQFENLFWGIQIQVFLVNTFAIAAFSVLAFARVSWTGVLLAALLGTAATFCQAGGVLVLVILPLLAIALRRPWAHAIVLGMTFIVVLLIYLRGYQSPPYHANPIESLFHLPQVFSYMLIYLGAPPVVSIKGLFDVLVNDTFALPRVYGHSAAGLSVGGVGLIGYVITAWYAYQMVRRPREFGEAHYVILAMMAFVVGTAFVTGLGRINFPIQQALASRYGTFALIFWAAALVLIWKAQSLTWGWLGTRVPIFASLFLLAFFVGQTSLSATARNWRERELWVKTALLAGANDMDAFRAMYPKPEEVADNGRALREERLSPFNEAWAMWRGTLLERHVAMATSGRCIGLVEAVKPIPAAQDLETMSWRVGGWGWDLERHSAIEKIVLVDNAGQVVGYALSRLPLTDVLAHEPPVMDPPFTGWAGHMVTTQSVREIRAYGLIDHDQSACFLGAHVITPR